MSDIDIDKTMTEAERKAKQLPEPSGYRLLCMVPKIEDTFGDSVIVKSEKTLNAEEQTTVVLFVAKMGADAYQDKEKFPNGPWCKVGDFIIVRAYAGTRLKIHGTEWRIINDDSVDGTVEDPRGIGRAG
jgi:co-chaperonin GroES (HSP10)